MEGLILRLMKKKQDILSVAMPANGFFVFGYYDVLEIARATKWMDFAPSPRLKDYNNYSHEIIVKLVKPPYSAELESEEKSSPAISFSQIESLAEKGSVEGKPLLTVAFLRYSRYQYIHTNTFFELTKETNIELAKIFEECPDPDRPIFAVYPTLGFMDAAAVFLSNNYTFISQAISLLKEKKDFLYTSYIVPCVSTNRQGWGKINDLDTRMAITGALKQGKSPEDFFTVFSSELFKKPPTKFYETFGSVDVQALPDTDVLSLIPLILKSNSNNCNNALSRPFGDVLSLSDTSVLMKRKRKSDLTEGKPKQFMLHSEAEHASNDSRRSDEEHMQLEKDFHDMLNTISTYKKDSYITPRNIEGLRSMACFYFDITHSPHSFDIREIMDSALQALIKNIEVSPSVAVDMKALPKSFTPDKLNDSILVFRDTFTDLMNDYARAERRMFECRWLKHPSTASNSKLILAYHLFLRDVSRLFKSNSKYDFLTVSGGVDKVVTDCLFHYVHTEEDDEKEHRIIILRIPEQSLYYPSATIYHILHEYFHFAGKRERRLRNTNILVSVFKYIGYIAGVILRSDDSQLNKNIEKIFRYMNLGGSITPEQLANIKNTINKLADGLADVLLDDIIELWNKKYQDDTEPSVLLDNWEPHTQRRLRTIMPDIESLIESFLFKHCDALFNEVIKAKPSANEATGTDNEKNQKDNPRWYESVKKIYSDIYSELIGNLKNGQGGISVYSLLNDMCDAYREAFCDYCCVKLLKSERTEYINSFRMNNWEQTDIKSMSSILRIGGVLKACYSEAAYDTLSTEDGDFDNLFNDSKGGLFKLMHEHDTIITPLVEYLYKCGEVFPSDICNSSIVQMRNIYHQMQPGKDNETPDIDFNLDIPETDCLSALLEKWTEAAKSEE